MIIEIISIGDEVVAGNILDTNKQYLSDELWQRGYRVEYHTGVRDDEAAIADALLRAAARADAVMCTGGLGPTVDDFTIEVAAKTFGVDLVLDDETLAALVKRFESRGRVLTENNKKQAYIPNGAKSLSNAKGTAPGVYYCFQDKHFFFMPGVPSEMRFIFQTHVLPFLQKLDPQALHFETKYLRTFGCPESELDNRLKDLMSGRSEIGTVRIGFRAHIPEVVVKASAWDVDASKAKSDLDRVLEKIYERIGDFIYSEDMTATLENLVIQKMTLAGKTLALAESCTGGLIANRITNVSGASSVFLAGIVSYSNQMKKDVLGVPQNMLESVGAVSRECAEAMVRGVQKFSGADYCAAVTGIAGPSGGTPEKPVGTVCVAWLFGSELIYKQFQFPYERLVFKEVVASVVLKKILDRLSGKNVS